jgi:hypothetical protein
VRTAAPPKPGSRFLAARRASHEAVAVGVMQSVAHELPTVAEVERIRPGTLAVTSNCTISSPTRPIVSAPAAPEADGADDRELGESGHSTLVRAS